MDSEPRKEGSIVPPHERYGAFERSQKYVANDRIVPPLSDALRGTTTTLAPFDELPSHVLLDSRVLDPQSEEPVEIGRAFLPETYTEYHYDTKYAAPAYVPGTEAFLGFARIREQINAKDPAAEHVSFTPTPILTEADITRIVTAYEDAYQVDEKSPYGQAEVATLRRKVTAIQSQRDTEVEDIHREEKQEIAREAEGIPENLHLSSMNKFCRTLIDQLNDVDLGVHIALLHTPEDGGKPIVYPQPDTVVGLTVTVPEKPNPKDIIDAATTIAVLPSSDERREQIKILAKLARDTAIYMDHNPVFEDDAYDPYVELLHHLGNRLEQTIIPNPEFVPRDQIATMHIEPPQGVDPNDYANQLFLFMLGRTHTTEGEIPNSDHNFYDQLFSNYVTFHSGATAREVLQQTHDTMLINTKDTITEKFAQRLLR